MREGRLNGHTLVKVSVERVYLFSLVRYFDSDRWLESGWVGQVLVCLPFLRNACNVVR